jgi:hypothetical protein
MGLDTKTYWLTDRQSQCDFDFDPASFREGGGGVKTHWNTQTGSTHTTENNSALNEGG